MKRNICFSAVCALLFALCAPASAQPANKIFRIGYVSGSGDLSNQGPYVEALRRGLRDLGYVERKNFVIEYRGAEGIPDRMPSLVAQLVELKVDVLVLPTSSAIHAAKQATKTIPIVMVTQVDPVALRLSRPWRVPVEISRGSPHSSATWVESVWNCLWKSFRGYRA